MSDIVERLRMQGMDTDMADTAREAADEIERLRAENARLATLLKVCAPVLQAHLPHGCVCPAGAEQTCQGLACPRRNYGLKFTYTPGTAS